MKSTVNIELPSTGPKNPAHITRKDYVDSLFYSTSTRITKNEEDLSILQDIVSDGIKAHGYFRYVPSSGAVPAKVKRIVRTYKANGYEDLSGHYNSSGTWVDDTGYKAATYKADSTIATTDKGYLYKTEFPPAEKSAGDLYKLFTYKIWDGSSFITTPPMQSVTDESGLPDISTASIGDIYLITSDSTYRCALTSGGAVSWVVATLKDSSYISSSGLPTSGQALGDFYQVLDATPNRTWNGYEWVTYVSSGGKVVKKDENGNRVYVYSYGPNGDTSNTFDDNNIMPWAGVSRVNLKWTSPNGNTYNNFFSKIPKFYYKREIATMTFPKDGADPVTESGELVLIAAEKAPGFECHPFFISNDGSYEKDYAYVSTYETYYLDLGSSVASADRYVQLSDVGKNVAVSMNRTACKTRHEALNAGTTEGIDMTDCDYNQYTSEAHSAICMLFFTEFCNIGSQAVIADNNNGSSPSVTGFSSALESNPSLSEDHNPVSGTVVGGIVRLSWTGAASERAQTVGMSYRGIENIYGNLWKFVGDVIKKNDGKKPTIWTCHDRKKLVTNGTTFDYLNNPDNGYFRVNSSIPTSNGYGRELVLADNNNWIYYPKTVGGSTTHGTCDYYYTAASSNAEYTVSVGGGAESVASAGCLFWHVRYAVSNAHADIGGRSTLR